MSDITHTPITDRQYSQLIQKMIADKVPGVVLGKTTFLVSDTGVLSVLGQSHATPQQISLFKTWLIKQYQ